jgi:DNA invertase Pin-like site-specific DNA recombinase
MVKTTYAAIYLRVSTNGQTVENQRRELEAAAAARGWQLVGVYADEGISGAKGRDGRPKLDLMLKDAVRRRFEVAMVWSVDRLGRSLPDLIASMQELRGARVDMSSCSRDWTPPHQPAGRCSRCRGRSPSSSE